MKKPALYAYHPVTALLVLGGAIVFSMLSIHPVYAMFSFFASALLHLMYLGGKSLRKSLSRFAWIALFILFLNTFLNSNGLTVWFYLGDTPIFLEGLYYGICSALVLLSILLWFACFSLVIDAERVVYLLGAHLPTTALLLSMALRRMGSMKRDAQRLNEALDGALAPGRQSRADKLYHGGIKLSALLGSSLESAVTTADSMRARGYGSGKPSRSRSYRFCRRDILVCVLSAVLFVLCAAVRLQGWASFLFYPVTQALPFSGQACLGYAFYLLLVLMPSALELAEKLRGKVVELRWKRSKSNT